MLNETRTDAYEREYALSDGHVYKLSYGLNEDGETVAGLYMDGSNFSMEHNGINVFIYDPLLEEIVEFAAFDPVTRAQTIRVN